MKNLRTIVILALLILMVSVAFVSAQDADENFAFSADAEGVIIHTFESGAFVANEDGTFSLTLEVLPENAALYFTSPSILAANYSISELSDDWAFANELGEDALVGNAHLEFGSTSVVLEVSTPIFDEETETLTYSATFVEGSIDGVEMKDGFAVAAAFEDASLFIEIDPTFISTLISGRDTRASQIRGVIPCLTCGSN